MPRATVRIPTPLRTFAGGAPEVAVDADTVGAAVQKLTESHPGLRRHLLTPDGKVRNFVSIYVNDTDVRTLQRDATPIAEGDVVSIVPAIAGGSPAEAGPRPGARPRGTPPRLPRRSPRTSSAGTAGTSSSRRSASPVSGPFGAPRYSWSAPADSAPRRRSTWPRRASAPSGWSTSTRSTSPTSSARSSTGPTTWGARSSRPRANGSSA